MKRLKYILAAFTVSFAGSLPMGYLNIAAWKIFSALGIAPAAMFLVGVVIVEALLVWLIATSMERLAANPAILKKIGWLSIFFLLGLAVAFFVAGDTDGSLSAAQISIQNTLLAGIVLSACNIMQVPFWFGWCLYLTHNGWMESGAKNAAVFALFAAAGTFAGMSLIVFALDGVAGNSANFGQILLTRIMPGIFLLMAGLQLQKLLRQKE